MKKTLLSVLALACIAVASQLISCTTKFQPVRFDEPGPFRPHGTYDGSRYKLDEIIVIFKDGPENEEIKKLKGKIHGPYLDTATIKRQQCNSCNEHVELWQAPNIHSRIHADGIAGGTVGPRPSQGVGEDGLAYYSLNFTQDIPTNPLENFANFNFDSLKKVENDKTGKEVVRIAVLDTGIDTDKIISTSYLWTKQEESSNEPDCYEGDTFGWNFIDNDNKVMDDNEGRHGTLVSQFIINEFATSENKAVELMTLKTHDKHGSGDLFKSICAIHYAMENEAQIINASWGFYYYQDGPHPYLDSLITQVLRKEKILFVAAAGNKIDQVDIDASDAYLAAHGVPLPQSFLRNLEYHNFYPACLSREDNNVITVTTAEQNKVSPTQNYSSKYVDFGAIPDDLNAMRFVLPFGPATTAGTVTTISGSSFAAPIVTGRIGASLPKSSYVTNIDKRDVFSHMEAAFLTKRSSLLQSEHIREGRITPHK